jgi:hypothetical protein
MKPPVKPDNIPNPPEGFTYAGNRAEIKTLPLTRDSKDLAYYGYAPNWLVGAMGNNSELHYAVRTDSEIHKAQHWCNHDEEEEALISVLYNPHRKLKVSDVLHRLSDEQLEAELERRRKPKTIRIGEYDVPEPTKKDLNFRDRYFIPEISFGANFSEAVWDNDQVDIKRRETGIAHLTKEAAIKHAEALISFTKQP